MKLNIYDIIKIISDLTLNKYSKIQIKRLQNLELI